MAVRISNVESLLNSNLRPADFKRLIILAKKKRK